MSSEFLRYPLIAACAVVWIAAAIKPHNMEAWALEQVASALGVALFLWTTRVTTYSGTALVGLALLFIFHAVGTHYTYSLTPYDSVIHTVTGVSLDELLGWERNHYDRFVHLFFGFAAARVFYENLAQNVSVSALTCWGLSLHIVISTSALYELMEWAAVAMFARDVGALYLGTQGDVWDAQADIALGGLGGIIAALGYYFPKRAKAV